MQKVLHFYVSFSMLLFIFRVYRDRYTIAHTIVRFCRGYGKNIHGIRMLPLIKNLNGRNFHWVGVSVLFFVAYYLFLNLLIKPELIYYNFQICCYTPDFKTGSMFLLDCLSYPGGLTQYLAAFFTQMCYFPWLGSLFIILIAWGLYQLLAALIDITADNICRMICFVPAILIFMICDRYEDPFRYSVALLIIMIIAVLYQKILGRMGWPRSVLFLISCVIAYYLAGGAALIFVVLAAIYELFERNKPVFCVTYLLSGTAVCWCIGAILFRMDESDSYLSFIPLIQIEQIIQQGKLSKFLSVPLLVFIPAAVLVINIRRMLLKKRGDFRLHMPGRKKHSVVKEKTGIALGRVIQIIFFFIITASCILFSYDWESKSTLQVNFFASRRMWPEVINTARKGSLKRYFPYCNNAVNRALFYTGRMGDEMFTFPQSQFDSDLVFSRVRQGSARYNVSYLERAEVCLDLGMVNVAEEVAYEFLKGPYILKQLAWINLVRGQIESARIYLNALSRYPAYAGEAKEMLRQLEQDPLLERNQRVQYLRTVMENNDLIYANFSYDEEHWLKELLRCNKNNKMAFEYLMAHYLLNRQLDKFVENLPRLDDFGYKNIPRHYQEAILIYEAATNKEVNLGRRNFDNEVLNQFKEISAIITSRNINDMEPGKLEPKYGKTYFFYCIFGYTK
jgi:hypothetical protein